MSTKRKTAVRKPPPLSSSIESALHSYLETLDGHKPCDLHKMVVGEAEQTLFRVVMERVQGNQSRAAEMLSMNRGTLRKKHKQYGIKSGQ